MKITRIERVRPRTEEVRPPIWLVGMTDLVGLLLAFFILLFATTQIKNTTWIEASKSMRSRFGGDEAVTIATGNPGEASSERAWDDVQRDPGLDLKYLYSVVKRQLGTDDVLKTLTIVPSKDTVLISLPMDTAFKPGDTTLSQQGKVIITHLAPFLAELPNTIEVVGHADQSIINDQGRFGSNWHLSLARAYAVAEALKQAGYGQKLEIRGRGTTDLDLLPKNLPDTVRNEGARRVDLRLHLLKP